MFDITKPYNVGGKEDHRINDKVHIIITITQNSETYTYDRYVLATDWDSDPLKVIALMTDYETKKLASINTITPPINLNTINLTNIDVAAKLV